MGVFLGLRLLFPNPSIIFDTMKNRIVSEKDLGEAINLLMEGNLPVSTATVINLVQRLQQTPIAPEPPQEAPAPKMEVVRDE